MLDCSGRLLNPREIESRVQCAGYQRDRHSLEARRLLNGNYLTVGENRDRIFLAETTDGLFRRKNGRNVVKIHDEASRRRNCTETVGYMERQIDEMLCLDKNRLSNGNYLTLEPNPRYRDTFDVVETTDGAFTGTDSDNFVGFHVSHPVYAATSLSQHNTAINWDIARAMHAAVIAEDARRALAVAKR